MGILPYGRDDMRLTFVVKGTGESVDRALIRHGLDARTLHVGKDFTTLETYPDCVPTLVKWFCEPNDTVPSKGYPDGTLLIYSQHENQDCTLISK